MTEYAIGIDLGGTAIKYAIVSSDGEMVYQNSVPTPSDNGAQGVIDTLAASIQEARHWAHEHNIAISGVGIGTPGIVSPDARTVLGGAENLPEWENIALAARLEAICSLPVYVTNDANAMAMGEISFGAARGAENVVFFTVGTGIGGAALIDGKMWRGAGGRGMEIGHITVKADGERCACGGRGCLEHYASTAALVRRYKEISGKEADGREIVDLYHKGDDAAQNVLQEHWSLLGHGVASVINIFSPQLVVIGGGISESGTFYLENLQKAVTLQAMKDCAVDTKIVSARLGNKAGCLGAAGMVFSSKY